MRGRVGIEIGGTFTDLVWQKGDGRLSACKVPSTPAAIDEAVLTAIGEAGVTLPQLEQLVHGSTVATNALLTRSGATTGLITTKGFRDVIEIGTHDRAGNVYQILYRKPRAPVPRALVHEVDERIDAAGRIVRPLDLDAAWSTVEGLIAAGVRSIAVCLLHAYANPAHERALVQLIRARAPQIVVTASCEISPEFREFERTMTTVVNAFVSPVVDGYLRSLERRLDAAGYGGILQIMQSNGGIMPAGAAGSQAVRMLLSGPAAGVRGAVWFARRNAIRDIITFDMGGTSTDVAIAPGLQPRMVSELTVDNLPIRAAAIDMVTVGAGGGSIAAVDAGGFLAVGPQSAGAAPGPACYGRGGDKATVTDAQVIAGLLRPARFFAGRMPLDVARAEAALKRVGMAAAPREVADAVLRTVNSNMAAAVRLVSTARGIDPRDFVLVAYGGGGPLHAAMVADEIGIGRVLVPWAPGLTSAFGLLVADLVIDQAQTRIHALSEETFDGVVVDRLEAWCREAAAAHGLAHDAYTVEFGLDLRYAGQAYELTTWLGRAPLSAAAIRAAFETQHRQRYGYARESLRVEAVNYRGRVVQAIDAAIRTPAPRANGAPRWDEMPIHLNGSAISARFFRRDDLPAGYRAAGPAVVEEDTATTVVPPGWGFRVLSSGELMLEKGDPR